MFLYQHFSRYERLNESLTIVYRKNCTFWKKANFCIQRNQSANFGYGERYWGDLKILGSNFWNFDFSGFFYPSKLSIFTKSAKLLEFSNLIFREFTKINIEAWKLACIYFWNILVATCIPNFSIAVHALTAGHRSMCGTISCVTDRIRFLPVTMTGKFSNFNSISYTEDRHELRVPDTRCQLPDTMSGTGEIFISGSVPL